ncbi:MAG: hypothetical protein QOG91_566 [Candidatus Parcubacteria bacterium]|jgi:hypothetical protein|nr:hypothetical protein [Candidatus Parcubacteria bacterium]
MPSHATWIRILGCVVLFVVIAAAAAYAQGIPVMPGALDLSLSTSNPAPGQELTITAKSYTIEIDSATLTWTTNGNLLQKGVGLTTYKMAAPPLGKKIDIAVTAVPVSGAQISGSVTVVSSSVDMIIETDGYVPPFFKGKLAPVYQNRIKVVAVPHIANSLGSEYDPKTIVYTWKKNDQVIDDQSGYGKQSITLAGDLIPRGYTVTVTAANKEGTMQASGYLPVSFEAPSINFYVDDPLYGPLYNVAIVNGVRIGSEKETGIIAVPFGFTRPAQDLGHLTLSWLVNGSADPDLADKETLILRAPENTEGSSDIDLNIQNTLNILQTARNGFTAQFSAGKPLIATTSEAVI